MHLGRSRRGRGCSYSLGHMWVPEPLETALSCREPTPRDLGLPTSVYLCSKPTPRPGSWATHGLFPQKLQKTARGPVPATTCPQQAALFKSPTQPLTGTTSPRQRGKGCRPAGPVQGTWCSGGPGTAAAGPHCPDNLTRPTCSELRPVPRPEALPCPGRYGPQARTGASSALYLVVWVAETEHPPLSSHSEARMAGGARVMSLDPSVCRIRPWRERGGGPYCLSAERGRRGAQPSRRTPCGHSWLWHSSPPVCVSAQARCKEVPSHLSGSTPGAGPWVGVPWPGPAWLRGTSVSADGCPRAEAQSQSRGSLASVSWLSSCPRLPRASRSPGTWAAPLQAGDRRARSGEPAGPFPVFSQV